MGRLCQGLADTPNPHLARPSVPARTDEIALLLAWGPRSRVGHALAVAGHAGADLGADPADPATPVIPTGSCLTPIRNDISLVAEPRFRTAPDFETTQPFSEASD